MPTTESRRAAWVREAIGDIGIQGDVPSETLDALWKAAERLIPDDAPAPKRKPRVQTPKDNPWPRKHGAPKRVVHADAEPTEKQIEMLTKLQDQKGIAAFARAAKTVGIPTGTRRAHSAHNWNRLQASQVIKELLAST